MFNRTFQVRMVKNPKPEEAVPVEDPGLTKWELISYTVDRAVKTIGIAAIGYVVVDTFRQVLVTQAANQNQ